MHTASQRKQASFFKSPSRIPRNPAFQVAIVVAIFLLLGSTFSVFVPYSSGSFTRSSSSSAPISRDVSQQINILNAHWSNSVTPIQKSPRRLASSLTISNPPPSWVPIGPQPIATNSTFTWGEPPFSGRITAIAVNGSNTQEIYVGAAQGGVWKSTDGGTTWTPLMDSQPNLAVGAIALSPDNKTIYVGTGEGNGACIGCAPIYYGIGILKSTDGGATWTILGGSTFNGMGISSILINPFDSSQILVSTARAVCCGAGEQFASTSVSPGIFLSTDGGSTWSQSLAVSPAGVRDLTLAPQNTTTGTGEVPFAGDFGGNASIYETSNFTSSKPELDWTGGTWSQFISESSGTSPIDPNCATSSFCGVAVASTPVQPAYVYVALINSTGNIAAVGDCNFESTTTPCNTFNNPPSVVDQFGSLMSPCNGQGWYDLVLSIDPTNANNIYFGCTSLYISTSGGTSWTALGGYPAGSIIHPDMHALVFMPGNPNTIFIGNDGGIWKSTNQGTSWNNLNDNLGITQFYYMAVSNSGKLILAGAQDNGCNEYNGSLSWNQVATGDGGWVGFDPANNQIMYCVQDGYPAISTDGGKTFTQESSPHGALNAPVAQDFNNSGTLYFGAGNIIYKTTNNMQSWTSLVTDQYGNVISIEVAPSNSSIIYAGDSAGNVLVSTNAGSTWSILGTLSYQIAGIAVNPANTNDVYVAASSFQSPVVVEFLNGAENIISTTGLPSSSVNVIKIFEGKIFAGLDSGGVYYLPLGASGWGQVGPALPNAAVFDLTATNGTLYGATHGRGVWAINTTLVEELGLTLSYQVVDGGSGYKAPTLTYLNNGVSMTANLSATPTTFNVDYGSNWSVSSVLLGSGASERWATSDTTSGTISSATTISLNYYHQYKQILSYSVIDGGSPSAPSAAGQQFGVTYSPTITTSPTSYWFDASGTITFPGSMNGGIGERWISGTSSISATSSATTAVSYYHQYNVPVSYSVYGGGSGYSAPILTYKYLGSSTSLTLTSTPNASWMDASSWSITNPLGGSTSTEQWKTAAASGTVASTNPIAPAYYDQYSVDFAYSVTGGGSGYTTPTLTYTSLGSGQAGSLTTTPTAYWIDSGGSWSLTNPLRGSTSGERWETNVASGLISNSTSISVAYYHQFFVSSGVSPSGVGTVSPSQSQWYDSGAVVQVSANPDSNYAFSSWSSSTPSISFGNTGSASTTATIDGSGTIQAYFYSLVTSSTTTQSSSPSITSSSSTTKSGGGGVPEFPFQTAITAVFTILIVASYLVIRRRSLNRP